MKTILAVLLVGAGVAYSQVQVGQRIDTTLVDGTKIAGVVEITTARSLAVATDDGLKTVSIRDLSMEDAESLFGSENKFVVAQKQRLKEDKLRLKEQEELERQMERQRVEDEKRAKGEKWANDLALKQAKIRDETLKKLENHPSKIKGAFGIYLGQPLSTIPGECIQKSEFTNDGILEVFFTPDDPLAEFETYMATLTPNTKMVAAVKTIRDFKDEHKCKAELKTLKHILEKKYGAMVSGNGPNHDDFVYADRVNMRLIALVRKTIIEMPIHYTLQLTYIDLDLLDKADAEGIENKAKETDSGGL